MEQVYRRSLGNLLNELISVEEELSDLYLRLGGIIDEPCAKLTFMVIGEDSTRHAEYLKLVKDSLVNAGYVEGLETYSAGYMVSRVREIKARILSSRGVSLKSMANALNDLEEAERMALNMYLLISKNYRLHSPSPSANSCIINGALLVINGIINDEEKHESLLKNLISHQ